MVPVTKVTDGDTIHVTYQGHDERVRLIGIDTPEVPWCRDRYGRLLAYVYLDRELFNLTLVRLGYARADPVPPDIRLAARFSRAEGEARAAGRGLWSACP